jgi:hypothetical protein
MTRTRCRNVNRRIGAGSSPAYVEAEVPLPVKGPVLADCMTVHQSSSGFEAVMRFRHIDVGRSRATLPSNLKCSANRKSKVGSPFHSIQMYGTLTAVSRCFGPRADPCIPLVSRGWGHPVGDCQADHFVPIQGLAHVGVGAGTGLGSHLPSLVWYLLPGKQIR